MNALRNFNRGYNDSYPQSKIQKTDMFRAFQNAKKLKTTIKRRSTARSVGTVTGYLNKRLFG